MGRSQRLRVGEVRAAVRLVGECREQGHDLPGWRRHLLVGVGRLVGAPFVLGGVAQQPDQPGPDFLSVDGVGWPDGARRQWVDWLRHARSDDQPFAARFVRLPGETVTHHRRQLVTDREWYGSAYFDRLQAPFKLDDGLIGTYPTPGGTGHVLNPMRLAGDRPFGRRECRLVYLLHAELGPHMGRTLSLSANDRPTLSPRLRQVLDCLMDGDSEKQAAARVGISPKTVHDHVKRLYRHFGVSSRAELLAYFLRRYRRG